MHLRLIVHLLSLNLLLHLRLIVHLLSLNLLLHLRLIVHLLSLNLLLHLRLIVHLLSLSLLLHLWLIVHLLSLNLLLHLRLIAHLLSLNLLLHLWLIVHLLSLNLLLHLRLCLLHLRVQRRVIHRQLRNLRVIECPFHRGTRRLRGGIGHLSVVGHSILRLHLHFGQLEVVPCSSHTRVLLSFHLLREALALRGEIVSLQTHLNRAHSYATD